MKPTAYVLAALVATALSAAATARPVAKSSALPISPDAIDRTAARAMQAFNVPGMAVGIIKDGKLIYGKGYGVREYGKAGSVDIDTLFQIGSNTKAFTAAALALLVDEGKLRWDDKVIDYIPEFRMYDPYVTREFSIRDLLTHRSGLGEGAGDLMFYPATDFSRAEIIHGLRYLKPVSSFRSKYDYDNLLYMVAGQIVAVVSGQSWEDFVTQRILDRLQMKACAASYGRIADRSNVATPHVMVGGKLIPIKPLQLTAIAPAGAISCNISGMAKWLQVQLDSGKTADGSQLFTPKRGAEMWSANTVMPLNPALAYLTHTRFKDYGLGWVVQDEFGYKRVSHTGAVPGTVTWVTMIPELRLGIVVLTNQQEDVAMEAVGNQILDAYVGAPKRDWVAIAVAYKDKQMGESKAIEAEAAKVGAAAGPPPLPLSAYAGHYRDPWRGDAEVRQEGGKLVLKISRTQDLVGSMTPFRGNIFIVRWNDRSLDADAYVRFSQGYEQEIDGMTMRAISPLTDSSFDFQDLNFKKVQEDPKPRTQNLR